MTESLSKAGSLLPSSLKTRVAGISTRRAHPLQKYLQKNVR